MPETYKIFPLRAQPGIKKDGTTTEGNYWDDGLWTRFYRGLPRSILGYRAMTGAYPGPSRGAFVNLDGTGFLDIFSGSASALSVGQFTTAGFGSGVADITPSGFAANPANTWQLDSFYNANGGAYTALIAHAAPNLVDISSNVARSIYYGDITTDIAPIAATTDGSASFGVSGGIVSLTDFVVAYGSDGLVAVSNLGDPSTFLAANQYNPTPTKIVKGLSVRGVSAPAALLWSLDSLILMQFVGGDVVWSFETISDQNSVLSSSGMVEFDGVYFWPGVDRFYAYNGSLVELPNEMNLDYFFSNLNFAQRQKVYGFKIPKWGEIWWCYPSGTSTECDAAIIYNKRENTWYSTALPADGRSAAYFAQSWQYPVMFGASERAGGYQLYQHEYQYDDVLGTQVNAIQSYVISPALSIVEGTLSPVGVLAAQASWTQLIRFEPDFLYGPTLNINILTREFAQDTDIVAQSNTIAQGGPNWFGTGVQGRYIRWQIESNTQGGFYIMGTPLISYREGDRNPT